MSQKAWYGVLALMLMGFWPAELISPRFDAFPSPDTAQRTYVKKSLPNCCAGFRPAIFPRLMSISKKPGRRFRIKNSYQDPDAPLIVSLMRASCETLVTLSDSSVGRDRSL